MHAAPGINIFIYPWGPASRPVCRWRDGVRACVRACVRARPWWWRVRGNKPVIYVHEAATGLAAGGNFRPIYGIPPARKCGIKGHIVADTRCTGYLDKNADYGG